MKKIQRLIMLLCMFSILGAGQAFGQDPAIICPADITISCEIDYTDTGITGIATAFGINGEEDVEYNDIIINLDANNQGFVRRRYNVVGRSDIFCDQTIRMKCIEADFECSQDVVASLTSGVGGTGSVKLFTESLASGDISNNEVQSSRNGVFYGDFVTYDCYDLGTQTFYLKYEVVNENGVIIEETCTGEITIEDKLAPVLSTNQPVYLSLYQENSVELTLDMLSHLINDNCGAVSATFSQSIFTSIGEYSVDYTISDASGNTSQGTLTVIIPFSSFIACYNNVNVSLDMDGLAEITPDMVLEGAPLINADYTLSSDGVTFAKKVILDCDDHGQVTQITVRDENSQNECWSNVIIEDKLPPVLSIPQTIYLTLNTPNLALLTINMMERFTYDNCNLVAKNLSQNTFTSVGTYQATYTVEDQAGNTTTQGFEVIVTDDPSISPACIDDIEIELGEDGTATLDYLNVLFGNLYLNYGYQVGVGDYLNTDFDFFDEVTVDCSHIGLNTIGVQDPNTGNFCWSILTVTEKKAPTPYAQSSITVSMNGAEPYVLDPALVDLGSFDNCEIEYMTVSPNTFTAPGTYTVKLRVYDQSGNSDFATSTVNVLQGNGTSIECYGISTVLLEDPFGGPTTLWAVDFVLNPDDFDSFSMSTSPNGPFTENFDFYCANYDLSSPVTIFVRGENESSVSTCSVELTFIDNIAPVAVGENGITLQLINGQATLLPEALDDGSYDFCGDITLSSSQTLFTTADIGDNNVILTVTDESGNFNQVVVVVTVIGGDGGNGCSINNVIFPADITLFDETGTIENLSIDNLQSVYNFTYENVHPYTIADCSTSISYAYADQVIINTGVIKILRTFTALDWLSNSIKTVTQIIRLNTISNTVLACNDNVIINVFDGNVEVFPQDVLEGGNIYNYDIMTLTLESNGVVLPGNVVSPNYVGQTITYMVTDNTTGISCWGTITVVNEDNDCPIQDEDISYPLEEIYIPNANIDPSLLTPDYLVANYGLDISEVEVDVDAPCPNSAWNFSIDDNVFNYTDGNFKIIREFVIIDWNTYDQGSTEGIWYFTQTINVGINPNDFICDILPNSAPVGDCDTGHTLEDDVEWPSDLTIFDYRVTPDELIEFSNIPVIDARPIFFNNPDDYTTSYIDLFLGIDANTVTVGRVWKAVNVNYDATWHYNQTIVIDFSGFENLVTINTITDRAVPGVIINGNYMTDISGEAQVEEDVNTISYEDDPFNGLNVKDLLLIQRHILAVEYLSSEALNAADINEDQMVKASDLTLLRKVLLGIVTPPSNQWKFRDLQIDNNEALKPKGKYRAYKLGDVNDDAVFSGDQPTAEASFIIEDQLLNNGEIYMIPVVFDDDRQVFGMEMRLNVDMSKLTIKGVTGNLGFDVTDSHVNEAGELVILTNGINTPADLGTLTDNVVFYIEAQAIGNGLLHDAISFNSRPSYALEANLDLVVIGGEIENVITGNNSPELASINVYPNPTSDFLQVDLNDVAITGNLNISVLNTQGQLVINQSASTVNVQSLAPGIYYYDIRIGEYEKKGKFLVIR